MLPVPLPRGLLADIYAHAEAGYPEEVCGLVFAGPGDDYPDATLRRGENRQNALHAADRRSFPNDARTAYNLGDQDLFALVRSLDGARPARIIYHSHADAGSHFSDEDARGAVHEETLLYPCDQLVVDVRAGRARGCRLYRYGAGRWRVLAEDVSGPGDPPRSAC